MTAPAPTPDDGDLLDLPDPVFTLNEAARLLKCSRTAVARLYHAGDLGGFRIGDRILVRQSDILAYIARSHAACPLRQRTGPEPRYLRVMGRER